MKISIKNFGPIHSFDFDLDKDFHVIYGKNNIGKSYAISVVYLILREILKRHKKSQIFRNESDEFLSEVKKKGKSSTVDVFSIKDNLEKFLNRVLENIMVSRLQETFSISFPELTNLPNKRSKEDLLIQISLKSLVINLSINSKGDFFVVGTSFDKDVTAKFVNKSDSRCIIKADEIRLHFKELGHRENLDASTVLLQEVLFKALNEVTKKITNVFFLPASRSGLYQAMNIFSGVFAKLSQVGYLMNEKIEIPSLSIPVSDYFLNISTIKRQIGKDVYHDLASEIENKILDAHIVFNHDTKKLEYYNKNMELRLDLAQTSSMISEVAPIVAYLKYIINAKETNSNLRNQKSKIIFIEEPEAHLHPEVQVQLTEIFAKLSQNGVKIVMTTHSNYLFNKVNNMILKEELSLEKVASYHIVNTSEGSIINPDNQVSREGIEDQNFVITAEKLYRERLEALENED